MFGGLVTAPSNSPHLRKSGSRPVVFDLGTIGLQAFSYKHLVVFYLTQGLIVIVGTHPKRWDHLQCLP